MNNQTRNEVLVCILIVTSATVCILMGSISPEDYRGIILAIIGYIVGRLNHRETREALQDFVVDLMDREEDPVLVSLSGKAGCGKSTIAKALVERFGFRRYGFADRLKEICHELFPEVMAKPKEEHRWLLQRFGTEWCRSVDGVVWVKHLLHRVGREGLGRVVVDDCRFMNEYEALKDAGFIMVRIERDRELLRKWGYNVDDPHPSETELDDADFHVWIQNDGPYPFDEAVEELVRDLGLR